MSDISAYSFLWFRKLVNDLYDIDYKIQQLITLLSDLSAEQYLKQWDIVYYEIDSLYVQYNNKYNELVTYLKEKYKNV